MSIQNGQRMTDMDATAKLWSKREDQDELGKLEISNPKSDIRTQNLINAGTPVRVGEKVYVVIRYGVTTYIGGHVVHTATLYRASEDLTIEVEIHDNYVFTM